MAFPTIDFQNNLSVPVIVYDSYTDQDPNDGPANYFGTLTQMGQVAPGSTKSFQPLHGPASVYIVFDANNNPVKRVITQGRQAQTFVVAQADVDVIRLTTQFVTCLTTSPDDPISTAFTAGIQGGKVSPPQIDSFFQAHTEYQACTFVSYMLVITTLARKTPAGPGQSLDDQTYSLSHLFEYLGVIWPADLPDIAVTNFSCLNQNDTVRLGCTLDVAGVTFADGVLPHILSFITPSKVKMILSFDYDPGIAFGNTALYFMPDNIRIPVGDGVYLQIDKPTILLTISPLFKFWVLKILATIPFTLFKSQTIHANVNMVIDNMEAAVGVVLEEQNAPLFTPPIFKGIHFDQIGVGIGVFFEPPGYAVGVQGKISIGSGPHIVALDDNTFAIVCEFEGDLPNPLYLSFYVPQMNLNDIVEMFTNNSSNIDFPVSVSDLSFKWLENPMEPVTLPDGTLAAMEYGFSGFLDLFGLRFYGDVQIGLNEGLQGVIAMDPFSLGPFRLSGNGKSVTIKVDSNGNPIPNNQIAKTSEMQKAIQQAATQQLIAPGGPELTLSSSASPYFTMNASASLFDVFSKTIDAKVANDGIYFELDSQGIVESKIACTLKDYHNFNGQFSYGLDLKVPLPASHEFQLGTVELKAGAAVQLQISLNASDLVMSVSGSFEFGSLSFYFGPYTADIHIANLTDLLSAIGESILAHASQIFSELLADAEKWASFVKQELITGITDVAQGLKDAFQLAEKDVATVMKTVGYEIDVIATGIKDAFDATYTGVIYALYQADYTLDEAEAAAKMAFYGAPPSGSLPARDFTGPCGENQSSQSNSGLQPNEQVSINGSTDLSHCMQANDGGCVYGITLAFRPDNLFGYVLYVDAQGPSGWFSGSMYLRFTDFTGDTYCLSILDRTRKMHEVGYNSKLPAILKIEWSDTLMTCLEDLVAG